MNAIISLLNRYRSNIEILLVLAMFVGCGQSDRTVKSNFFGKYNKEILQSDETFQIMDVQDNEKFNLKKVYVVLEKKLSIGKIATIAEKIYQMSPQRERIYIYYDLRGIDHSDGCWATSHLIPAEEPIFPHLKIEISGLSLSAERIIDSVFRTIKGEKIANCCFDYYGNAISIFRDTSNKVFCKEIYSDGSNADFEMTLSQQDDGIIFNYADKREAEMRGHFFLPKNKNYVEDYNEIGKRKTIGFLRN